MRVLLNILEKFGVIEIIFRDLRITRKVVNRCFPTMRYLFMTLQL
jgi:hypothetical protein